MSSKPSKEMTARHLLISGRVQGVGFRYHMTQQARALNLLGWCRNLPDGRVEALVQGPLDAVEEMVEWAQRGPTDAIVEHVEVEEQAVLEPMLGESVQMFEVRR